MRTDAPSGNPDPVRAGEAEAGARAATWLVIRCVVQGLLVALLMSALDPLALSILETMSRR